jgi:FdhD protein
VDAPAPARVELNVNDGELRLSMLCLARDLAALAVGFLTGEGALRGREGLRAVDVRADGGLVVVRGDFDADVLENIRLRWTWGTGCGGGGTARDVDAPAPARVAAGEAVSATRLLQLAREIQNRAELWRRTGGVHACALADRERILFFAEDVGRHNAFDKVVGMAVLAGADLADKIAITTGRLSAEIVSKAVCCRLPILVSRSAVTGLAVRLARRFGLTLVGFVRGRRLSVYTGYERVRADEDGGGES